MKQICVVTQHPIVSLIISNDSSRAITIQRVDDQLSKIAMYSLDDYETTFEEDIRGEYIKIKRVEQNRSGTTFACVYIDDGKFRMRIFGKEQRDSN